MKPPNICPDCGASLDYNERCDCRPQAVPVRPRLADHPRAAAKAAVDGRIARTQQGMRRAAMRAEPQPLDVNEHRAEVLALCY